MSALLTAAKKHVKALQNNKAERWGHIILQPGQSLNDVSEDPQIDYMVVIQTYEQEPTDHT